MMLEYYTEVKDSWISSEISILQQKYIDKIGWQNMSSWYQLTMTFQANCFYFDSVITTFDTTTYILW